MTSSTRRNRQIAYEIINYGRVKNHVVCEAARFAGAGRHAGARTSGGESHRAARSTHLCPGGCVNSPSPVAPFPPGVVVRAAPVLRRTKSVPPRHPLLSPPPLPFF